MRASALIFAGPGRVEVWQDELPRPGPGEILVKTTASAVSAGTELLAYSGQLPLGRLDETLSALTSGENRYPLRFGYAAAGVVIDVGPGVDAGWRGRRVFGFAPHASAFVAPLSEIFTVPDEIPDEVAPLFANAETATNLVLDAQPLLGERVGIVGQGVVGLLVSSVCARFPLERLCVIEPNPTRAALARRQGLSVFADAAAAGQALAPGADLTFELTGNPAALDDAIAITAREGRVVVGSFYGSKRVSVDLGGHFHRGRLRLISSQVSHLPPALAGRWDRARRAATAWRVLAQADAGSFITDRVPLAEAPTIYQRLAQRDPSVVQVVFRYE